MILPYRTRSRVSTPNDVLNSVFESVLAPAAGGRADGFLRVPEADVVETEQEIRVSVELPGLSPEHIDVSLESNVLTVTGEKREARTEGDERHTWHLSERRYGRFSRSFVLPRDVEQEQIAADFENGVLRISIPKSQKSRRRRIEVGANGGAARIETGEQQ